LSIAFAGWVEYVLPLGPLGRFAHEIIVGKQLKQVFNYRQEALAELFKGTQSGRKIR